MLPDYQKICQVLWAVNAAISASQAHGVMTGMICVSHIDEDGQILSKAILALEEDNDHIKQHQALLDELGKATVASLKANQFDFQLLLPDDDCELTERAEALGHWCEGFTMALSLVDIDGESTEISQDCKEIILRFKDIASVDAQNLAEDEDEENDFMELCEYVRMAAMMLYDEFHHLRPRKNG